MQNTWNTIKTALEKIAPGALNHLQKGISASDLENLEQLVNAKLPQDFVDFYKIHDGQETYSAGLIETEELLSFERITEEWTVWKEVTDNNTFDASEPDMGIKNNWWNPLWLPITYDGSANHYCLDLDPTAEGSYGQIIRMRHDDAERKLVANSFTEWIVAYSNKLSRGQMVYSDDYFGIIDKNYL